jgi:hypothetical protein
MSDTSIDAGRYEIRVRGHLDPRWAAWFDGTGLTAEGDGTTVVHCPAVDQAALHGVLRKLRDIGLPLISVSQVEQVQPDQPLPPTTHHPRTETQP